MPAPGGEKRGEKAAEELLSVGRAGVYRVNTMCICHRNCRCGTSLRGEETERNGEGIRVHQTGWDDPKVILIRDRQTSAVERFRRQPFACIMNCIKILLNCIVFLQTSMPQLITSVGLGVATAKDPLIPPTHSMGSAAYVGEARAAWMAEAPPNTMHDQAMNRVSTTLIDRYNRCNCVSTQKEGFRQWNINDQLKARVSSDCYLDIG